MSKAERGYLLISRVLDGQDLTSAWQLSRGADGPFTSLDDEFEFRRSFLQPGLSMWQVPPVERKTGDEGPALDPTPLGFLSRYLVADVDEFDPPLRDELSAWGVWRPLGGEGAGYSVLLPHVALNVDEEASTYWHDRRAARNLEGIRFAGIPDVGLGVIVGLGTILLEASEPSRFRQFLSRNPGCGAGLLPCWDRDGTTRFPGVQRARNLELWE